MYNLDLAGALKGNIGTHSKTPMNFVEVYGKSSGSNQTATVTPETQYGFITSAH